LDLFGVNAKLEGFDDYRRETGKLYKNRSEFRERISKGIEATSNDTVRNVLAGYCFGGAAVLEGARAGFSLDGFVSFHGGLATPEGQNYLNTQGTILLLHGSADPVSGMDDLAGLLNELTAAGVEHTARIYGGARHSFTVQGSRDYLEDADKKSWQAFLEFLSEES
jgi:dienelactone hydrolase